jgi:hypothetical protein
MGVVQRREIADNRVCPMILGRIPLDPAFHDLGIRDPGAIVRGSESVVRLPAIRTDPLHEARSLAMRMPGRGMTVPTPISPLLVASS